MFLTVAKIFTWNKTYTPITITNENGKGKPFFSYSLIFRPATIGNDVHDM